MRRLFLAMSLLAAVAPTAGLAHSSVDGDWIAAGRTALLLPGVLVVFVYALGVARLWRRAGVGRGLKGGELCAFAFGVIALLLALVWPLDQAGEYSLAAHMAQHMVLLALAPPLLLLGRPMAGLAQGLPRSWSRRLHRSSHAGTTGALAQLTLATMAHCTVMLVWHLPAATAAALTSDPLHWAMHGSFLIAGLWFWSALLHRVREPESGAGPALIAIVAVMMTMGLLGALLVFAPRPLYPVYVERAPVLGLEPLADQQLAGLIMWVPAALPYLIGGLWLAAQALRWQQRMEARPGGAR